jgi:hypothetical protein
MDAVVVDGHRGGEQQRLVVAVHADAVARDAARQLADLSQGGGARRLDDVVAERLEMADLELAHHVDETPAALVVAGGEGVDVALDLERLAHVGAHDPEQVLVHRAGARQGHDRQRQPFLEDLPPVRAHAEPADIDDMHRRGEEPDRPALVEGRADHGEIVKVPASQPGIVGDVVIALPHAGERIGGEEVLDRVRHRVDVARRAGDRLGQHAALGVEDAGREVAGLPHRGREGGAHQRLGLLLDDGDEARPHDLHVDLRKGGIRLVDHGHARG